ncbi:MAG: TPR domain protein in aerotolerance operon [Rhodanobacteraceae bacterium]|nr:MAG: TPR domain protein in aerotolerance operon [Rhodanobacteraceae bacterium]
MNPIDAMSGFGLHFLRPWWWLALAPLPLALWMLARSGGGRAALSRLADAALLPHLLHDTGARRRLALGLCALAWTFAVAALTGPAWQKVATPLYVNGAARVVVLSLSDDMLAQDLKPDRMTRARFAVRDLLDDAGDARTALVAYAGAAFTVAPLTDDKRTVLNFLQALQPDVMPVPGNDAAAGIRQGLQLLQQAHVQGGEIVLVTDTAGAAAQDAARAAHARGVRVDVVGIGTEAGAPVPRNGGGFASGSGGMLMARRDDAALRAVASAGGGRYVALDAEGSGVAALGAPVSGSGRASRGERAQLWRDGGVWLLPVLAVLASLAFRRGWLLALALCALPAAMPVAHASTWSSLWSNRDQRALHALQDGDAARARELATTPGVRGAAEYRSGDYAGAAKAFAQGDDARARYNLGNALAKQGEYAKAIAAYRQALDRDPEFADARANLDAVEAWLKRHSQASPSQGQGQSNQQGQREASGADRAQSQNGQSHPQSGQDPSQSSASPGSSADAQGGQSNPSATSQGRGAGKDQNDGATSAAEAARQQRQSEQAAQGLKQALQGARGDASKPQTGTPGAFALGQSEADEHSPFDASQRALLRAVPDDPGALLRRKFRLEWERRNGQSQENGQ